MGHAATDTLGRCRVVGVYPRAAASVAVAEVDEMSGDRVRGEWDETKGVIKEQKGKITGDRSTEVSGKLEKAKGKLEKKIGDTKRRVRDVMDPKR